jgi:hypothetical protein
MDSTSQTTSQTTRKLRSSCDACGDAKTKCDRNQPQCTRCISLNLTCVYGPSRQFGKRPRRRLEPARNTLPMVENQATTLPQFPSNGAYISVADMDFSTGVNTTTGNFGDPSLLLPSLPSIWPQFENYDSNEYTLTTPISICQDDISNGSIPTPPSTNDSHKCYHEPNDVLENLTIRHFTLETQLDLSEMLHKNKSAVEYFHRFLDCRCSKTQPDMVLFHASLVARVLYFYRASAGSPVRPAETAFEVSSFRIPFSWLFSSRRYKRVLTLRRGGELC